MDGPGSIGPGISIASDYTWWNGTPSGAPNLLYEATGDPKVFTASWKVSMPLYRRQEKNAQIMEFRCVEFVEELMYGHLRKLPSQ